MNLLVLHVKANPHLALHVRVAFSIRVGNVKT